MILLRALIKRRRASRSGDRVKWKQWEEVVCFRLFVLLIYRSVVDLVWTCGLCSLH